MRGYYDADGNRALAPNRCESPKPRDAPDIEAD